MSLFMTKTRCQKVLLDGLHINLLASYEDTDMTPAEIEAMKAELSEQKARAEKAEQQCREWEKHAPFLAIHGRLDFIEQPQEVDHG